MQIAQFKDLKQVGFKVAMCLLAEELFSPILQFLPFFLGSPFRWIFLKILSKKIGNQVFIAQNVSIRHCYNLEIGSHVGIGQDTMIHCRGRVSIGNHVFIGQRVMINTGDHDFIDGTRLIRDQATTYRPVKIGSDVFIGMGAIILPGVNVADGSVVAAGAVVVKDTEPYSIVAGVPACKIKERQR